MMLDVYELKLAWLPMTIPCRVLYFAADYLLIAFGAAFTMGKVIGSIGECMDHHVKFVSFMTKKNAM